jgi:hypothetical protein
MLVCGSHSAHSLLCVTHAQVTQEKSEVGSSSATLHIVDVPHKLIAGSLTVHSVSAVLAWSVAAAPTAPIPPTLAAATAGGTGKPRPLPAAITGGRASQADAVKPLLVLVTGSNRLYTFREVRD